MDKVNEKNNLTKTIQELCNEPNWTSDSQVAAIETLVLFVYYPKLSSPSDINIERMNAVHTASNCDPQILPFSDSVCCSIKRTYLQGGWL